MKFDPAIIAKVKAGVNIIDLISPKVKLKKTGRNWVGLCPFHAEKDGSFTVCEEKQIYHCFGCGVGGDVIGWLVRFEGIAFPAAVRRLAEMGGVTLPASQSGDRKTGYRVRRGPRPPRRKTSSELLRPRTPAPPAGERWISKASAFVGDAHDDLVADDRVLRWFRRRGIKIRTVRRHFLGVFKGDAGKDRFRPRQSWGLPPERRPDGRLKRLWLPRGVVIPHFDADGRLVRIRIRRNDRRLKYYVIPGSGTDTWAVLSGKPGIAVVESELDAMLIHQEAGDLVDVIALGSSATRPDHRTYHALGQAACILMIPDIDRAGLMAARFWATNFEKAVIYPVPLGKDPGDAFAAGVDIRAWIRAGLPPGWRVGRSLLGRE